MLNLLTCINCHGNLGKFGDTLECADCGQQYPLKDGVPDFHDEVFDYMTNLLPDLSKDELNQILKENVFRAYPARRKLYAKKAINKVITAVETGKYQPQAA